MRSIREKVSKNLAYPMDVVHQKTIEALTEMEVFVTEDEEYPHQIRLKADYFGEEAMLEIKPLTKKTSTIKYSCRFSWKSDQSCHDTVEYRIKIRELILNK